MFLDQKSSKMRNSLESQLLSLSVLNSKRSIEQIENVIQKLKNLKEHSRFDAKKWHITSSLSLEWKVHEDETGKRKNKFTANDIQKDQKTFFVYLVEQWKNQEPYKVIYKWIRTPKEKNTKDKLTGPNLLEQHHIFRGLVRNYHKNGQGVYIIVRKLADDTQKITQINGIWNNDILENGTLLDETGKQQVISQNLIKLNSCSTAHLLQKNATIRDLKKKTKKNLIPFNSDKSESQISLMVAQN